MADNRGSCTYRQDRRGLGTVCRLAATMDAGLLWRRRCAHSSGRVTAPSLSSPVCGSLSGFVVVGAYPGRRASRFALGCRICKPFRLQDWILRVRACSTNGCRLPARTVYPRPSRKRHGCGGLPPQHPSSFLPLRLAISSVILQENPYALQARGRLTIR